MIARDADFQNSVRGQTYFGYTSMMDDETYARKIDGVRCVLAKLSC